MRLSSAPRRPIPFRDAVLPGGGGWTETGPSAGDRRGPGHRSRDRGEAAGRRLPGAGRRPRRRHAAADRGRADRARTGCGRTRGRRQRARHRGVGRARGVARRAARRAGQQCRDLRQPAARGPATGGVAPGPRGQSHRSVPPRARVGTAPAGARGRVVDIASSRARMSEPHSAASSASEGRTAGAHACTGPEPRCRRARRLRGPGEITPPEGSRRPTTMPFIRSRVSENRKAGPSSWGFWCAGARASPPAPNSSSTAA